MLLNIVLALHVLLVIIGLCFHFYNFTKLSSRSQRTVQYELNWFGKAALISLLILLYRIGG